MKTINDIIENNEHINEAYSSIANKFKELGMSDSVCDAIEQIRTKYGVAPYVMPHSVQTALYEITKELLDKIGK